MASLRELQLSLAADLLGEAGTGAGAYIRANGLLSQQRLQVYRNNRVASYTAALQACYPVLERLVGGDFFAQLAKGYCDRTRARSANLHEYGAWFAAYLQSLPVAADLPYLADVARLEWACQEVYHAAEVTGLGMQQLARIAPEDYPELRWVVHPAVRLLQSAYPIVRIWQVNQPDHLGAGLVSLDEGGVACMVTRQAGIPEIQLLSVAEFTFLQALAAGQSLLQAQGLAAAAQADFEPGDILTRHIHSNTLTGCFVPPRTASFQEPLHA